MKAEMLYDKVGVPKHPHPATMQPINFKDKKIAFAVDRCRGKRVLDLGCVMHDPRAINNSLFLHRAIHEVAAKTVGLDLDELGVENMCQHGFDVRVGDAESFDLAEKFDVIVAGDIIEHLSNLDGLMQSVDTALADGGTLLVMTPNPWHWRYVIKSVLGPEVENNPEHTCWFCPRTWRQLVARYGYTLGEIQWAESRRPLDRLMPLPRGLKAPAWA